MRGYFNEDLSPAELEHRTRVADDLTADVRRLVSATVLTDTDDDSVAEARRHIAAATAALQRRTLDSDHFGIRYNSDGSRRHWGNAMVGRRNPIAPPMVLHHDAERTWAEFELGAQYEGPGGLVHGGVLACVLDQVLGSAAEHAGAPGMTGTLTIRYRRATPLGPVRAEGRLDRVEGIKSYATGSVSTADGVTVEAEGVFILPRWARAADGDIRTAGGDA
nr:PaaI family thioesterase [Gordonia soli]